MPAAMRGFPHRRCANEEVTLKHNAAGIADNGTVHGIDADDWKNVRASKPGRLWANCNRVGVDGGLVGN
jgi:hypothetical protein